MGGSKGSAPTPSGASTTTASSTQGTSQGVFAQGPSNFVSPLYQDFLARAQGLSTTPFNPATQSTVAPLNEQQTEGLDQLFSQGMDMGNFDPARVQAIESPFIQDVVGSTQDWFNNQNSIQGDELMGKAIQSGNAFGGDRAGIAEAQLAGQQQLAQAPVIAGLYQSGYTQALDEYNRLKQFGITGAEEAVKAGTVGQAQTQREQDVATQNAMMSEAYPFQIANWYGSALGGVGPLTGTVGSAQSATTSDTSGITNPPTPNPLNQALGIGSSLIGIGGGLGLFKSGGRVARFDGGGFVSYNDDNNDDSNNNDSESDGGADPKQEAPDSSSDINPETGRPMTDYERELKTISEAGTPEPPKDLLGKVNPPKYKQPYDILSRLKNTSGGGSSGSSANSTGSTQPSAPAPAPTSNVGKTLGTVGGTIAGGPVGGVIGGAVGSILDKLKGGGSIRGYADGEEVVDQGDEGDTEDNGDTEDTGDTAITLPSVSVSGDLPPTTTVAAQPPPDQQPPSWLGPGVLAQPETRRPVAPNKEVSVQTPQTGKRPEGPPEEQPTTDAGGRGYSVQRIPELGPRPRTFAERWAANPFTQLGAGMLSNTSPHFGPGLAAGVNAATHSIEANRKQDLLDNKPQIMTQGDTISYRVGDQIIKTTIPTQTRAQSNANERLKARQSTTSKTADASRETAIARLTTAYQKGDMTMGADEARRRAILQWNTTYPDRALPVPEAPAPAEKPAAGTKKPPGDTSVTDDLAAGGKWVWDQAKGAFGWVSGKAGEAADAVKDYNQRKLEEESASGGVRSPAVAAPAAPAAPQQAPQAAPKSANPIADALKSGTTTKDKIKEEARQKLNKVTDEGQRQIIFQRLKENGIDFGDLISAPQPNAGPRPPMSH